jgi:hypothetical protein
MKTQEILKNVDAYITTTESIKAKSGYTKKWEIRKHCDQLGIFDWWNETLSLSQLKQMKKFLETAIEMGYTGYACFKVGAKYCSHGMWANKNESTNGHSPAGATIYHSFRSGENYWDACLEDGTWLHDAKEGYEFTLSEVKQFVAEDK